MDESTTETPETLQVEKADFEAMIEDADVAQKLILRLEAQNRRQAALMDAHSLKDDEAQPDDVICLSATRMEQLQHAVDTLQAQKSLVVSNGNPPPFLERAEHQLALTASAYDGARLALANYESQFGNLGGPDLSGEAKRLG